MDLLVHLTSANLTVENYQEKFQNETNSNVFQSLNAFEDFSSVLTWIFRRIRGMLYLSNPYEESFEFMEEVPDFHMETFPFLVTFVLIEWLAMFLRGKPLPFLGDTIASASMIVFMECIRIFTRGIEHRIYVHVYDNYRLIDLPWNSPFTWYLSALLVDFFYYVFHRATHVRTIPCFYLVLFLPIQF